MGQGAWPARPDGEEHTARRIARSDRAKERLAQLHAEVRVLLDRRAATDAAYRAGKLTREEYSALTEELRNGLHAAGLEMHDIHAASA